MRRGDKASTDLFSKRDAELVVLRAESKTNHEDRRVFERSMTQQLHYTANKSALVKILRNRICLYNAASLGNRPCTKAP